VGNAVKPRGKMEDVVTTRQGGYGAVVKEGEQAKMNTRKVQLGQALSLRATEPNKRRLVRRPWRHLGQGATGNTPGRACPSAQRADDAMCDLKTWLESFIKNGPKGLNVGGQ
jgi:hypothetical protein